MRIRTSHAPDGWRDEGPTPAIARRSKADPFFASTIADMAPVVNYGGLMSMSPKKGGHDKPKPFVIHRRPLKQTRTVALAPVCGYLMPILKEPCARMAGHARRAGDLGHRSRAELDARRERKRAATPPRKVA